MYAMWGRGEGVSGGKRVFFYGEPRKCVWCGGGENVTNG